jgi:hypothetical protein
VAVRSTRGRILTSLRVASFAVSQRKKLDSNERVGTVATELRPNLCLALSRTTAVAVLLVLVSL